MTDRELLESINNKLDYIVRYIDLKNTDGEDMKLFVINVLANGFRI